MKWKDYKIMLENNSASVSRVLSVLFLALTLQCIFIQQKCFIKNIYSINSCYASQVCSSGRVKVWCLYSHVFPDLCVLRVREMVTVVMNALGRMCGCSTDATLLICRGSESRAGSYVKQAVSFWKRKSFSENAGTDYENHKINKWPRPIP